MKGSNRRKSANAEPLTMPQIRSVAQYFRHYGFLVHSLPFDEIERAAEELLLRYQRDQHIFLFGNGGSAALASHLACDLGKGTIVEGNGNKRFRVLSL